LGKRFSLTTALRQGCSRWCGPPTIPRIFLKAYNGLYLREEVQMEGLVRNVGSFARFLEAMSFRTPACSTSATSPATAR